ncbi:MAG: hypothetical protein PF442_13315 [Desulfobulbaceae bacterium]|jgi:hypothetical protein|nr:hypothetical protein [Desulfobulbaceae bacterium]
MMDFSPYTSVIQTMCFDEERIICNQLFRDALRTHDLTSFAAIFNFTGGECLKEKDGLEIRKIAFADDVSFFIKKHWQPLKGRSFKGEGCVEFAEYVSFRENGLATPIPVACGEKRQGDVLTSFLITQDFSPLVDLEGLVLDHPDFFRGEANRQKRCKVLRAIGRYARQMHGAGCNQKDFNATHILLGDVDSDLPRVALFDLQRVDRNPLQRLRWPVKALAELLFTLPEDQFDREDHVFLLQAYLGRSEWSFLDRLLYRWIQAKRNSIARHSQKRNLAPKMG